MTLYGTYLIAKKKPGGFLINFLAEAPWIARGVLSHLWDIVFISCVFAVLNFWGWWSWARQAIKAAILSGDACPICYSKMVKIDKGDIYVYRCHSCRGEGQYHHKRDELDDSYKEGPGGEAECAKCGMKRREHHLRKSQPTKLFCYQLRFAAEQGLPDNTFEYRKDEESGVTTKIPMSVIYGDK
jgi:hypothetical protein